MQKDFRWVSCLSAILLGAAAFAAPDAALRDAVECTPRGGLPNFFAKCAAGGEVTVAYLGGSITEQSGWRVQSLAHFQQQYPACRFKEVNAAIGGTGSQLGVFRVERDVLQHRPDLLFVEFAVNDSSVKPEEIVRQMEGIVRKTRRQLPGCDLCFVYTVTVDEKQFGPLKAGKMSSSASAMERVADHYGIPTIHMGMEVARLEKEDRLQMRAPGASVVQIAGKALDVQAPMRMTADGKIAFAADGVHPYTDTGHRLYTEAILRALPALKAAAANPKSPPLSEPLDVGNLEQARLLNVEEAVMTGPWTRLSAADIAQGAISGNAGQVFLDRLPSLWRGEPGAEMSFRFKGSLLTMYEVVGPDSGTVEITVDGRSRKDVRFSPWCTYHLLSTMWVAAGIDANREHHVVIKVLAEPLDKEKILPEGGRRQLQARPERYQGINWYPGAILLVGEPVNQP